LLDPPFGQGLLEPVCAMLERNGWLADAAWIYLEAETELERLPLPVHWMPYREKIAGAVSYRLARRETSTLTPGASPARGRGE
jgi:16S rRNA (guanine966-N2)-methyltransferase